MPAQAARNPRFIDRSFSRVWNNLQGLIDLHLGIESAERKSKAATSAFGRVSHRF